MNEYNILMLGTFLYIIIGIIYVYLYVRMLGNPYNKDGYGSFTVTLGLLLFILAWPFLIGR